MLGQTLNNRYSIQARLGEGAMGEVYRALDIQTQQAVAVKIVTAKLASDAEMLERFRREGEALRQLRHANIVAFVDMFSLDRQQVIVMEYVVGGNLHTLLSRGPLPVERAVRIALELSDALARAHHLNIIHRDIKPENVLLTEDGLPKLTDFGVARLVSDKARLTGTGTQIGTPYYMSPEAWEGRSLDPQTDIWSLGVMLYEMLAGHVPFEGDTLVTVMNRVLTAPLPNVRALRPEVSPALVEIIQRMMARDKGKRYRTMRQVAVDLEKVEEEIRLAAEGARRRQEETRRKQEDARRKAGEERQAKARPAQAEARRKAERTQAPIAREEPRAQKQNTNPAFPRTVRPRRLGLVVIAAGLIGVGLLIISGLGVWARTSGAFMPASQTATPAPALTRATSLSAFTPTVLLPSPTSTSSSMLSPRPSHTPLPSSPTPSPSSTPLSPTPAFRTGSTQVSPPDGMTLLYVPAGNFTMGSSASVIATAIAGCWPEPCPNTRDYGNEGPEHKVNLDAFWIDRTPVTNAMYASCLASGQCSAPKYLAGVQYAQYPVVWVSWEAAQAYCTWAGRRLPTEAEWEKAARGIDGRLAPWGNQCNAAAPAKCDHYNEAYNQTVEVGKYPLGASPYGALDMVGNVYEWVNDWYDARYYAVSPADNPTGPSTGIARVTKGGGWYANYYYPRAAGRLPRDPSFVQHLTGFRCASSAAPAVSNPP